MGTWNGNQRAIYMWTGSKPAEHSRRLLSTVFDDLEQHKTAQEAEHGVRLMKAQEILLIQRMEAVIGDTAVGHSPGYMTMVKASGKIVRAPLKPTGRQTRAAKTEIPKLPDANFRTV